MEDHYADRGWNLAVLKATRLGALMALLDRVESGDTSSALAEYHQLTEEWELEDAKRMTKLIKPRRSS